MIATHPPILLACPDAQIFECAEDGMSAVAYDDTDAVRLTRSFLEAPERSLRATLEDLEPT